MFFLITHIITSKYYPSLLTQFIIGCSFYTVSFFILKDILTPEMINKYKYYVISLFAIDISYIYLKSKSGDNKIVSTKQYYYTDPINMTENNSTDFITIDNLNSSTLTSEINDYKVKHDLSLTETGDSIFALSDEHHDNKPDNTNQSTNINVSSVIAT